MKCLICSSQIKYKNVGPKPKYCSKKCRYEMDNLRSKQSYMKPKQCLFCESIFDWQAYVKYCSSKCKNMAQYKRNKNKKTYSHCAICKKQAVGSYGWKRKYCSKECRIQGIYEGKPPVSERSRKAQRNMRERKAPGLNVYEIRLLRIKWQSEGKVCFYCSGQFDTIDHIIPLMRGGDNMEKNLAPCCRSCNSSKGSKLLSEWKPDIYASR